MSETSFRSKYQNKSYCPKELVSFFFSENNSQQLLRFPFCLGCQEAQS